MSRFSVFSPLFLPLLCVMLLSAAPAQDAYSSDDARLESHLAELKENAAKDDAYSLRQLYLRYAQAGKEEQALAWAQKLLDSLEAKAAAGDTKAAWQLGRIYLTGDGCIPPNRDKAARTFTKLADTGDADAAYLLADMLEKAGNSTDARMNYAHAYGLYKQKAAEGNLDALFREGYMEQMGQGTDADPAAGIDHMERAAKAGCHAAAYRLFATYTMGIGTAVNEARALEYARQLADEAKDAQMAYLLADAYFKGSTVPADASVAEKYLEQAVLADHPAALYHKAWLREEAGEFEEALTFYRRAAAQGHADAAVRAGTILVYGKGGVEADDAAGLNLLQMAANHLQSPIAAYELGRYFGSIGESGLSEDWYMTAARGGLTDAMAHCGWLHLNPFSSQAWSPTEAYRWWKIGKDSGDKDCRLCLNLYLFAFIPLILTFVFGTPIFLLCRFARKTEEKTDNAE